MKVSINHEEVQKGLVFKKTKYQVSVDVEFTEEERHAMKENNLHGLLFNQHDYRGGTPKSSDRVFARQFFSNKKPIVVVLNTPNKAQLFEADFKENLSELKGHIENVSAGNESSTFEL